MSFFAPRAAKSTTDESSDKPSRLVPWVEKYRPKCVDEISHQDEVVDSLRGAIKSGNVPHLLFYGPPGTGKTSTILAAAHELFGTALLRKRVLELNASDERGISVIREKVKAFASTTVSKETINGKPAPPFKIIILDEADSMTMDAQSALRRTMEKYTRVTRFCLICNYISRIIEPLASRCAKFRFQPLSNAPMRSRLEQIAELETVKCLPGAYETILDHSQGDMRKAITLMQSAAQYSIDNVVTSEDVTDLSGTLPPAQLDRVWETVQSRNFSATEQIIADIIAGGYSVGLVIQQLFDKVLLESPEVSDDQRAELCTKLAEADKGLECGANEELQLRDVLLSFCKVFTK